MMKKAHVTGGICAGIIANKYLPTEIQLTTNPLEWIPFLIGLMIGSLLPDIDTKTSYLGRRFRIVSIFCSLIFKHRKFIHTVWFALIFTGLLYYGLVNNYDGVFFTYIFYLILGLLIGMLSHITLDSLTVSGVPMFYPLIKKKYSLLKIRTGKEGEEIFRKVLIVFTIWFVLSKYMNII